MRTHTVRSLTGAGHPFEAQLRALRVLKTPCAKLLSCILDLFQCQALSERLLLYPACWQQDLD